MYWGRGGRGEVGVCGWMRGGGGGSESIFACHRSQKMSQITNHRLWVLHNHRELNLAITDHREYLCHRSESFICFFTNHRLKKKITITNHRKRSCTPAINVTCYTVKRLIKCPKREIWAATWQNKQSDWAPSEDSDQPGHRPRLIGVFAMRLMGS